MLKHRNKIITLIALLLLAEIAGATARRGLYSGTLSFLFDESDFVLLGECTSVSDETIEVEYPIAPDCLFTGPRYATYRIIKVWKNYPTNEYLTFDFLPINQAYEPKFNSIKISDDGQVPYFPEIGELAYIFVKDNKFLSDDYRSYVPIEQKTIDDNKCNDTLDSLEYFRTLDDLDRIEHLLRLGPGSSLFLIKSLSAALVRIPVDFYMENYDRIMKKSSVALKQYALMKITGEIGVGFVYKVAPFLYDASAEVRGGAFAALMATHLNCVKNHLIANYDTFPNDIKTHLIKDINNRRCSNCEEIFYRAAKDTDLEVRIAGINALYKCSDNRSYEIIYSALNDTNQDVQAAALSSSRNHIMPILANYCMASLKSENDNVKSHAIIALGEFYKHYSYGPESGNYEYVPSMLAKVVRSDDSSFVRQPALYVLSDINSPLLHDLFSETLYDKSPNLRANTAWLMGRKPRKYYEPLLNEALKSENDEMVINSIQEALKKIDEYYLTHNDENVIANPGIENQFIR